MKDAPINQCDGCRRGDVIVNGNHRDERGHPYMTCTANRYAPDRVAALESLLDEVMLGGERDKNWRKHVAAPSPAEPLLPRECRHCYVRCADCPEPAEPPAAPVQQEPVAWRGTCKSMPQPDWTYETERGYLVEFGCDHIEPLYTHPEAERDRLRAELAEAKRQLQMAAKDIATLHQEAVDWYAERDRLRALIQGILDNHGHVFEHQIAEIRAALSGSKYE